MRWIQNVVGLPMPTPSASGDGSTCEIAFAGIKASSCGFKAPWVVYFSVTQRVQTRTLLAFHVPYRALWWAQQAR